MGVQIPAGLTVDQADGIAITNEPEICLGIVFCLVSVGIDEPIIIGIFVVVASNLLLVGTFGVSLNMGM